MMNLRTTDRFRRIGQARGRTDGLSVGLLTLPLLNNYGGLLQAAALYRLLEDAGHRPVLLAKKYHRPKAPRLAAQVLRRLPGHDVGSVRSTDRERRRHAAFVDATMPRRSPTLYSHGQLQSYVKRSGLDAVVVGSDQVWRSEYLGDEDWPSYFLDLRDVRRVAYAASMGAGSLPGGWREDKARELLGTFDAVSVRERSAIDLLAEGDRPVPAQLALDPTLVVDDSFYRSLYAEPGVSVDASTVFSYTLDRGSQAEGYERLVESALGWTAGADHISLHAAGERPTVAEWLTSFRDAGFVVTDSFHGTLMSILHRKPFVAIANQERGVDRFASILGLLGLDDRLVGHGEADRVRELADRPIDYDLVGRRLDELRAASKRFLEGGLS